MRILGIHAFGHDANAALLVDGIITAFREEERLSRKKHDDGFPYNAIKSCLESCNLSINQIDMVIVDMLGYVKEKIEYEIKLLGYRKEVIYIRHHDSHGAAAFFASGFEEAAILIVDGHGSVAEQTTCSSKIHYLHRESDITKYELQSFYRGKCNELILIKRTIGNKDFRNGIGILYTLASRILNFGEFGAGKVMGLSSYGKENSKYNKDILEIFDNSDIVFEGSKSITEDMNYYTNEYFDGIKLRENQALPDEDYTDLAYKVQLETENAMMLLAEYIYNVTGCKKFCLGGGVALNGLANLKILEKGLFDNIFIFPATSDSGCSIGNVLYAWNVLLKGERKYHLKNAFFGKIYTEDEILHDLMAFQSNIEFRKYDDINTEVSKLLAKGEIIGWFQGGSEAGPRALGHRSILGDPRNPEMKDKMNLKVKHREGFRPFAPAILDDYCNDYFYFNKKSPYMLFIARVREEKKNIIPAVIHIDGTARLQTVNNNENKTFYDLIYSFYRETDVPLLLNTSFNKAGEPIVETPADALRCFLSTDIDQLAIGNYLINKK